MGILDGRRRKHAHDLDVALRLVIVLRARMDEPDFPAALFPFSRADVEDLIEEATSLRDGLLDGQTPEPAFLRHVQRGCRGAIQALKRTHPEDVVAYMDELDNPKDQRLIRSM